MAAASTALPLAVSQPTSHRTATRRWCSSCTTCCIRAAARISSGFERFWSGLDPNAKMGRNSEQLTRTRVGVNAAQRCVADRLKDAVDMLYQCMLAKKCIHGLFLQCMHYSAHHLQIGKCPLRHDIAERTRTSHAVSVQLSQWQQLHTQLFTITCLATLFGARLQVNMRANLNSFCRSASVWPRSHGFLAPAVQHTFRAAT